MNAPLVKTLISAGVVLLLTLLRSSEMALWGSFVLVVAVLIFLPWAIYSLIRLGLRPAERQRRGISLAVWVTTLVLAFSVRAHWDSVAREKAVSIASVIQTYKARTGAYPSSLREMGFNPDALHEELSLSYRVNEGKAALFYSRPSMPTVAYHYNFETNAWQSLD